MTGVFYTTEVVFISICIILVLLILIQKGRGGGLASAFGGGGGQTAFGSKTGDVLTWTTSVVFGLFLVFAVLLNLIANRIDRTRYGGQSSAAVPLTAADRSTLPKPPPSEPGIRTPTPAAAAAANTPPAPTNAEMSAMPATTMPATSPAPIPTAAPPASTTPSTLP